MYTSIKSPYFPMHENIEWPYYRPLSPNTRRYYDEHVFYPSNDPYRFQDVLSTDRCLRCFSSNHEGKSCTMYLYPTPRICPFCRFLYHDEQDCIYKDQHIYDSELTDLSSTPSSRSSSPLSSSLPASRSMTPMHYDENVHYDVHTHYSNIHDAYNHYQHGYHEYQSSSFCFSPDLDYPDQHNYTVDDIDSSSSSQDDISDTFNKEDNFLEHNYGHDLMYDIYPLPGSPTSPTLNNPSCSLSAYSDNLHLNQEMSTKTLHTP